MRFEEAFAAANQRIGPILRTAQAVIFDVEGTLIDCVTAILDSWQDVLGASGFEVSRSDLQRFSGRDTDEMLEELLPKTPAATRQRVADEQLSVQARGLDSFRRQKLRRPLDDFENRQHLSRRPTPPPAPG